MWMVIVMRSRGARQNAGDCSLIHSKNWMKCLPSLSEALDVLRVEKGTTAKKDQERLAACG